MTKDLYTILDEEDQMSDAVERGFYGEIDNFLGKFLSEIFEIFELGKTPDVSGDTLSSVRRVMYEMVKRTPEFIKNHDDLKIGREVAEEILSSNLADKELTEKYSNEKFLRSVGRDVRVRATLTTSKKVRDVLEKMEVRWAISSGKPSYILSSMIAYRIGNGGPNGLKNPKTEIWMPISPKHALVLVRDPDRKIPLKVEDSQRHIREVNCLLSKIRDR